MTPKQEEDRRIFLLNQAVECLKEEIAARNISIIRIENLIMKLKLK